MKQHIFTFSAAIRLDSFGPISGDGACGVGRSRSVHATPPSRNREVTAVRGPTPALVALLAGFAGGFAGNRAAAQCYYTYTTIPNPPGEFVRCGATAINNRGHVAGIILSLSDNYRSFIWTPEGGRFDLPMPPGVSSLVVRDINDLGHVCGYMHGASGLVGFIRNETGYVIIDRPSWANGIDVLAINNTDQVVGTVTNNITGPLHAFVWHAGTFTDLGPSVSDTDSFGADTNELGLVAGTARGVLPTQWRAFIANGSLIDWLEHPSQLDRSSVVEMSNNGFVAGLGKTEEPLHFYGIVWTPWGVEVVAPPPEFRDLMFAGINDAGRIVGRYERPIGGGGSNPAFVWQHGSISALAPMVQPSAPPGLLARDINNAGQIAASFDAGSGILNPVWVPGDLTGDCVVMLEDLLIVLGNFGSPLGTFPRGDVDLDGDVDLSDLAVLLSHWGE